MTSHPIKNGDIVLVTFPFTNLLSTKVRPALVISQNIVNALEPDVTLAFISSVIPESPEEYEFIFKSNHPDFKASGLKMDSNFKLHKITTVEKRLVKRRLGHLGKTNKLEISQALIKAIGPK